MQCLGESNSGSEERHDVNTGEFFDEARRLNLRMLGTPEEIRAALDAKDAEIERLRTAQPKPAPVLLTDDELYEAYFSAPPDLDVGRAIEAAVLKKNGICSEQ